MKIVIDNAIPFIKGVFEPYAKVEYIAGDKIDFKALKDADGLVTRTRTRCNESLLKGSKIKHIASATIGYDHIDLKYCKENGIGVSTAAGCNARGVLQWMSSALYQLSLQQNWQNKRPTIGIVGVGNVGSLIAEYCDDWGFQTLLCDPPRAEREGGEGFVSLEQMLPKCDILTLHTPLDESTFHLINKETLALLPSHATIINSSRGEVIDSKAIRGSKSHTLIFDVWENEPTIDSVLLKRAFIATPHIAGYSIQGKATATAMAVASLAQALFLPISDWYPDQERSKALKISWQEMCMSINKAFDIKSLSQILKKNPANFEQLRNNYVYRKEYF